MSAQPTLIDGKYTILSKLREGGMGTIYKVRHNLLDEIRVIKFMRPAVSGEAELDHRFLQEARLVTRFSHPNIAAVYDFSVDDEGTAYIAMEYVDGMNLIEMMRSMPHTSLSLLLEITRQTLEALAYLHRKNVVHRDISPDNIMITIEDGYPTVKLIDLGIAKALDSNDGLTKTGFFLGKLKYASPEQLGNLGADERLDARSDIYSFSVVLYELVTGRLPFRSENPRSLVAAHLFEAPTSFEIVDTDGRIPDDLRTVILRGLEKARDDRYPDAEAFRQAIESVQRSLSARVTEDEVEKLRQAIQVNHPSEDAAAFTPSMQNRMNRQFAASATTPHPGGGTADGTIIEGAAGPTIAGAEGATLVGNADRTIIEHGDPTIVGNADRTTIEHPASKATLVQPDGRPTIMTPGGSPTIVSASPTVIERQPRATLRPAMFAVIAIAAIVGIAAIFVLMNRQPEQAVDAPDFVAASTPSTAGLVAAAEEVITAPVAVETVATPTNTAAGPESAVATEPTPAVTRNPEPEPLQRRGSPREATRPTRTVRNDPAPTREPAPAIDRPAVPAPVPAETRAAAEQPRVDAPPANAAPSDEQLIRRVMQEYVAAQVALDVERYAAVYPSVNRDRIRTAFRSFRSQSLDLEISDVSIAGNSATVTAHERRVAVPRVGTEQTISGSRTFTLRRSGGGWVIASVR